MPKLEVQEATRRAIRRSTDRADGLACGDARARRDGDATEVGVDGEVVPVAEDDGSAVAWDDEDTADDAEKTA